MCYSCLLWLVSAFPYSSQKLPSVGEQCIFVNIFAFEFPFHTRALKSPFAVFQSELPSRISRHSFSVCCDSAIAIYGLHM